MNRIPNLSAKFPRESSVFMKLLINEKLITPQNSNPYMNIMTTLLSICFEKLLVDVGTNVLIFYLSFIKGR